MIILLCCFEFHMIVLKAKQATIMQMWKDKEREAKERVLVSDFFFVLGSKDLCCSECHMIVLLCCYEFHMIVLKVEHTVRMQRWKDEEYEAKEHMLEVIFFFLNQKIFVALSAI
jgi:hypothetical protein